MQRAVPLSTKAIGQLNGQQHKADRSGQFKSEWIAVVAANVFFSLSLTQSQSLFLVVCVCVCVCVVWAGHVRLVSLQRQ